MAKNIANKIIRGTNGRLWLNDKLMANVKSFECKITANYEELDINNEPLKQYTYIGGAVAGTMVLHKVDSKILSMFRDAIKSMVMPEIYMVAKASDPNVVGAERVKISRVVFDEIGLANFENAAVTEESVPFKAGEFDVLDVIEED